MTSLQQGINIVGATGCNTSNSLLFISLLSNCVTTNHPVEHIAARSDSARVIKEQFMGLSHSDGGGRRVEKASATTNTPSDADEGKINFLGEEVSGVKRLSLHSDVNYLGVPD